jgi:hypothetical protein
MDSYSFFVVLDRGTLYSFSLITATLLLIVFLASKAYSRLLFALSKNGAFPVIC